MKAFFLAPRVVAYITAEVCILTKREGPFKVNWDWFKLRNRNPSRVTEENSSILESIVASSVSSQAKNTFH